METPERAECLQDLRFLVRGRIGLELKNVADSKLANLVASRVEATHAGDVARYVRRLHDNEPAVQEEWGALAAQLTIGESFFFRDKGQLGVLRQFLFPELVKQARSRKRLRIWSAGCARGEEPYSLAIILSELLVGEDDWDIEITGTDINMNAIHRAKIGEYSDWSLRGVDPALKKRYFTSVPGRHGETRWKLDERIRKLVKFQCGNLVSQDIPSTKGPICDLDLVLCRNVFIYFSSNVVQELVAKFNAALRPGGYFVSGHGELFGLDLQGLETRLYPKTVVYRRPDSDNGLLVHLKRTVDGTPDLRLKTNVLSKSHGAKKRTLGTFPKRKARPDTSKHALSGGGVSPSRTYYILARMKADQGAYGQAWKYAKLASDADPFSSAPFHLMAHLSEEQGNTEEAKQYLKKILYLDPAYVAAYLDLASIYEQQEAPAKAQKVRATAMEILASMPEDQVVEPYETATVAQVSSYLKETIKDG